MLVRLVFKCYVLFQTVKVEFFSATSLCPKLQMPDCFWCSHKNILDESKCPTCKCLSTDADEVPFGELILTSTLIAISLT